jgi:hypothetical protein
MHALLSTSFQTDLMFVYFCQAKEKFKTSVLNVPVWAGDVDGREVSVRWRSTWTRVSFP